MYYIMDNALICKEIATSGPDVDDPNDDLFCDYWGSDGAKEANEFLAQQMSGNEVFDLFVLMDSQGNAAHPPFDIDLSDADHQFKLITEVLDV